MKTNSMHKLATDTLFLSEFAVFTIILAARNLKLQAMHSRSIPAACKHYCCRSHCSPLGLPLTHIALESSALMHICTCSSLGLHRYIWPRHSVCLKLLELQVHVRATELCFASLAFVQHHLQSGPIETSPIAKAIKGGVCSWEAPPSRQGGGHRDRQHARPLCCLHAVRNICSPSHKQK